MGKGNGEVMDCLAAALVWTSAGGKVLVTSLTMVTAKTNITIAIAIGLDTLSIHKRRTRSSHDVSGAIDEDIDLKTYLVGKGYPAKN